MYVKTVVTSSCSGTSTACVFSTKSLPLPQSKPPVVTRNISENSSSEIYLWYICSFTTMFQTNVEALRGNGTSITESGCFFTLINISYWEVSFQICAIKNKKSGDTNVGRQL
jgi:hypothetical protein